MRLGPSSVMTLGDRAADIARFDALGPLAKEAIRNAPMDVNVGDLVGAFRKKQGDDMWSLPESQWGTHPLTEANTDKALAEFIAAAIRKRFGNPPETFKLERQRRHG